MSSLLFDLSGKNAIVIGGTTGIGRSIALGLAGAGANVLASSRSTESCAAVAAEIERLGRKSLVHPSDVSSRESLESLRDRILRDWQRFDILVNAAGRTKRTKTLELSEEEWSGILETNLTGTFRSCQIFGKVLVEQGAGSIINVASLSSFVGFLEVAAYTSSKSGVAGFTRALAVEFAPKGVRVNAVAPGLFPTAMNGEILRNSARGAELLARTPMKRFGRTEEVAGAAIFLASEAASFITGELITVDGGFLASGVNQ